MPTTVHSGARLNLAPLYRHCLLSSDEPRESHLRVAQEFSDHQLQWGRGPVDTVMYRAPAHALSIVMLRYGAPIEIRPEPFEDFALVHMTLQGLAEIEADGQRIRLAPGCAALVAPRRDLRMHWSQDAEQLILKVPGALLRACGGCGDALRQLPSVALLAPHADGQWTSLLQTLLMATTAPPSPASATAWIDHLENCVASYVLHQGSARTRTAPIPPARAAECAPDLQQHRLDAMDLYLQTHLGAPISLVDIARATGVSVRSLHSLSLQRHGVPPMERLRALRLDAVRAQLLQGHPVSVTQAALQCGFGHLGRFSAYYRERFGELPSASQRRH